MEKVVFTCGLQETEVAKAIIVTVTVIWLALTQFRLAAPRNAESFLGTAKRALQL